MKKTYIVPRMTDHDFGIYMVVGYNYKVEYFRVEAESAEEAIEKVRKKGYSIVKSCVAEVDNFIPL